MMVEALVYFFVPALVGVLIGIASGLLGIGGGTVMVPIFRLAFGMSATMSTATSLFAIIPTSISGAISHVKGKTCIPALGIAAGLGGARRDGGLSELVLVEDGGVDAAVDGPGRTSLGVIVLSDHVVEKLGELAGVSGLDNKKRFGGVEHHGQPI